MRTTILFATSLRAILHHKIRSLLTILGIITGIAAIIGILAIGHGAEKKIRQEILSYGDNYLFISPLNAVQEGLQSTKIKPVKNLVTNDIRSLAKQSNYIKKISPVLFDRGAIEHHGALVIGDIKSGNSNLLSILGRPVALGNNFSSLHVEKASRVAVIGHQVALDLFKNTDPIGATIQVKKTVLTVVGVIKELPQVAGFNNPNLNVFIPITTLKKYLRKTANPFIHGIAITATNLNDLPLLANQVTRIMRVRHNLEPAEKNDFKLFDQYALLNTAAESSKTFNIFLFIIAAISLLVGGIGVMNIMLVSITERQQEIGIRMALGAKRETILLQFLYEALILCVVGGIIGIVVGIIVPYIAHYVAQFPIVITLQSIGISIVSMLGIGLLFGYYPAHKASQLEPIKALTK